MQKILCICKAALLLAGLFYAQALHVDDVHSVLSPSEQGGRRCLPTHLIPIPEGLNLTDQELLLLDYLCLDEDAFVISTFVSEERSGIPPGVSCEPTRWCDSGTCTDVCARGTVTVDPWLAGAVRLQSHLARSLPLCFSTWFGTHNSAISLADGYGNLDPVYQALFKYVKWAGGDFSHAELRTNDQWLSLTDQMNLGVRVVELDTHWVEGELRVAHCGGLHVESLNVIVRALNTVAKILGHHIRWDTETMGCDPSLSSIPSLLQRTFLDALQEVGAWMAAPGNEDEFLVLFLDDQPNLEAWGVVNRLQDQILSIFPKETIFTQHDLHSWGGAWPTAAQMVASGRRVLFVSVSDYGPAMAPLIFPRGASVCGWMEPSLSGVQGAPECVLHTGSVPRDLFDGTIIRIPTCELVYGPLNCDFVWCGSNLPTLDEATLPGINACGVNIPSPDLLTPSRAAAAVWTWAPGQPETSTNGGHGHHTTTTTSKNEALCAAITADDARWRAVDCNGDAFVTACRKDGQSLHSDDQWVLGNGARGECPAGSLFDLPRHPRENYWLASLLRDAGVTAAWLPIQGPEWSVDGIAAYKTPQQGFTSSSASLSVS